MSRPKKAYRSNRSGAEQCIRYSGRSYYSNGDNSLEEICQELLLQLDDDDDDDNMIQHLELLHFPWHLREDVSTLQKTMEQRKFTTITININNNNNNNNNNNGAQQPLPALNWMNTEKLVIMAHDAHSKLTIGPHFRLPQCVRSLEISDSCLDATSLQDLARVITEENNNANVALVHLGFPGSRFLPQQQNVILSALFLPVLNRHSSLQSLDFTTSCDNLSDEVLAQVVRLAPPNLQELDLTWNYDGLETALALKHKLLSDNNNQKKKKKKGLRRLSIMRHHCQRTSSSISFLSILTTLCDGLKANNTLEELSLQVNNNNNDDELDGGEMAAVIIVDALIHNSTLQRLHLHGNHNSFFNDQAALVFANHLCRIQLRSLQIIIVPNNNNNNHSKKTTTGPLLQLSTIQHMAAALHGNHTLEQLDFSGSLQDFFDDNDDNDECRQAQRMIEYYLDLNWGGTRRLLMTNNDTHNNKGGGAPSLLFPLGLWALVLERANKNNHLDHNKKQKQQKRTRVVSSPDIIFDFLRNGFLLK